MAERAQVSSVEAIAAFRAKLIVFLSKARTDVEEVGDEVQRVRVWLESDRRTHWEQEFRKRSLALQEAHQQLFSAKISRLGNETAAQTLAVERAKRALHEAEEKRAAIKRWSREFENRAQPLAKQVDQLLVFLSTDLGKAVARLSGTVDRLEAYAGVGVAPRPMASPSPDGNSLGHAAAEPDKVEPAASPGPGTP